MDSKSKFIVSVDVGSSTIKCQIFDPATKIIGQACVKTEVLYPKSGWVEIDPDFIWTSFLKVVNEAVAKTGISLQSIVGIGISSQRGTFINWDKHTGEPFHNFIAWNDLRADHLVKSWDSSITLKSMRVGAKLLYLLTRNDRFLGASVLRISNKHISMRLLWVMDNIPKLRSMSKEGRVLFGTIDTWLVWKLTGGKVHVTDYSMASSSAMYDPYLKEWAGWAFNLFNIPFIIMPGVCDTSGNIGFCTNEIFGVSLPILAMAGDQQAATFGHCCFNQGDMKCTLGTGTFFNINTGLKPHTSMAGLYPLIGWKYGSVIAYLAEGSSNDTGSVIQWAQSVGLISDVSNCASLSESVENSGGVCFIPGFSGLQAPINNDTACAGFIGLKYNTKREELVRAVIESLAFRIKLLFDAISGEVNFPLHDLQVDGGVSQNDLVLQLIANLINKPIHRSAHIDMSCLGIAFFVGLAAGIWTNAEELKNLQISERTFEPKNLNDELISSLNEWKRAVERCLSWYDN